jgi:predicted RNA-binding Zn-ribbon protein involved in translation (DUF1610 family)
MTPTPLDDARLYEFVCPERGERFEVDAEMRKAIRTHGCPVCGASVLDDAFAPSSASV